MNRYYLSPIIGSGTEADPYRPKIADYGVDWAGVIKSDASGHPAQPWCLVLVNTADHSKLLADADLDPLPDVGLSSALSARDKAAAGTAVSKRGVKAPAAKTMADLVRHLGRQLEPSFDVTRLRVG